MTETTQQTNSKKLVGQDLALARFSPLTDDKGRKLSETRQKQLYEAVHFNPETLDISFTNTIQKGRSKQPAQTVTETTAKLSVELIFDTTLDGSDVRSKTIKIAKFMDPDQKTTRRKIKGKSKTSKKKIPAIVAFEWGTIRFEGYIDSFKEKLELFSPQGIPLRSVVSISMTQQQRSVDPLANDQALAASQNAVGATNLALHNNELSSNVSSQNSPDNRSVTQTAQALGDPSAGRRIADQNGIENMRFPEVDKMAITDELQRGTQPLFSSSMQLGGALQGSVSKRFAGLHTVANPALSLTPRTGLFDEPVARPDLDIAIGPNTSFGIGGKVSMEGSASIRSDVGVDADLQLDIQFED